MSAWSWLLRFGTRPVEVDDELSQPGPVLDEHGNPVLGADGRPLEKVRVVTRRDWAGDACEWVWCDPRTAGEWREGRDSP